MKFKTAAILIVLVLAWLAMGASRGGDKEKDALKQSVDDLKTEITILERQMRDMQQSLERNSGTTSTLITQMTDNVSAIRQGQSRTADSAAEAVSRVSALGEGLRATNDRIGRVSDQITELRRDLQNLCKQPAIPDVSPGNPDDLFSAGVADYHRKNYPLALNEFKQYVEIYGTSPLSLAKGQYWIGDTYSAMGNLNEAIAAYEKVTARGGEERYFCLARLKKIRALLQLGQNQAARDEFQAWSRVKQPKCQEEMLAAQQEIGSH